MNLTVRILAACLLAGALLIPALRWRRAAFAGFIGLGVLSFALRAGWPAQPLAPTACELLVAPSLMLHSFSNTPHIILFASCFVVARAQFRSSDFAGGSRWRAGAAAFVTTMALGMLLELAQGVSGAGNCRLRDLLPDAAGALLGWTAHAVITVAWTRWRA